jgi:hypothetical protein
VSTWADYRIRSSAFWGALFLGPLFALGLAEAYLIERWGMAGLLLPLLAWILAVAGTGRRLQAFLCPRCEKRFFHRSPPLLPLRAERCVHCMQSKD